jgi:D-alanyl-D-alanine carboxypeptidase (penicillin-binding protein 5/6)
MQFLKSFLLILVAVLSFVLLTENGVGKAATSPSEDIMVPAGSNDNYSVAPVAGLAPDTRTVKAGLLYDVSSNKVVWEKGLYSSFPIASLTKMMTVLLVREDIRDGKTGWDSTFTVGQYAPYKRYGSAWMQKGQTYTVQDLIKSAMISSSNDACIMLAQHAAGSEQMFISRMNNRALELGMYNTYFSNTNGLPAPKGSIDNFSSPHDLLILARALMNYEDVLDISGRSDEYVFLKKNKVPLRNHNRLAVDYPEVDGLKTGFTRKAGFCIVATANKSTQRLIAITLGSPSPGERNEFVADLFNSYYNDVLCLGKLEAPIPVKYVAKPVAKKGKIKVRKVVLKKNKTARKKKK